MRSRTAPLLRLAVCALPLALLAGAAAAHSEPAKPVRELMRIQGSRAPAPAGTAVERATTLVALGEPIAFAATEWRSFGFADASASATPEARAQYTLQGERPLLRRLVTARPDQRVTILAERRPGSADLFVLSIDLCPEP